MNLPNANGGFGNYSQDGFSLASMINPNLFGKKPVAAPAPVPVAPPRPLQPMSVMPHAGWQAPQNPAMPGVSPAGFADIMNPASGVPRFQGTAPMMPPGQMPSPQMPQQNFDAMAQQIMAQMPRGV